MMDALWMCPVSRSQLEVWGHLDGLQPSSGSSVATLKLHESFQVAVTWTPEQLWIETFIFKNANMQ